ncbi:MAG: hypothetical protein Q8R36_04185 [bacterium]|nr:hypothetical protein [bacterium]
MSDLISQETEAGLIAAGITVTRSRAGSKAITNKEGKPVTTITKPMFKLPPRRQTAAQKVEQADAFNDILKLVPDHVTSYALEAAELLVGDQAATETIETARRFCDADPEVFPDVKNFVGDQGDRFKALARTNFLAAMLRQQVPDGALESISKAMLELALKWDILEELAERPKVGIPVGKTWYAPTEKFEKAVYGLNILALLDTKFYAATRVGRNEQKEDSNKIREEATKQSLKEFLAVGEEDLTEELVFPAFSQDSVDQRREIKQVATYFLWFPRQTGGPSKDGTVRYVTNEGGALISAWRGKRTWKDRESGKPMSYEGIFVSLVPARRDGPVVVDGKAFLKDNDKSFKREGKICEAAEVKYSTLSKVLVGPASPYSQKGYALPPRALPLECLQGGKLHDWKLELPYQLSGSPDEKKQEFADLIELRRHLSWAIKCGLQKEAEQEAYEQEKAGFVANQTVDFAQFYGLDELAGTSYGYVKGAWQDVKGKYHKYVHFLASRAEVGGEIVLSAYPERHKALLTDPKEFLKIVRRLKNAARSVENPTPPAMPPE